MADGDAGCGGVNWGSGLVGGALGGAGWGFVREFNGLVLRGGVVSQLGNGRGARI